jgi:hypothetical protein
MRHPEPGELQTFYVVDIIDNFFKTAGQKKKSKKLKEFA